MYAVTNRMDEAIKNFSTTSFADIPVFKCDYTAIRTAARTDPCIYLLRRGTVQDKQSHQRLGKIVGQLESLVVQKIIPPPGQGSTAELDSAQQTGNGN